MIRRLTAAVVALMLLCGRALADYKELTVGSKDTSTDWAVYSLQLKLIELDYLDGIADGIFGSGTAAAVSAFQEDYNLEATGIADVAMQELLFSLEAEAEPGATPSPDEEVLDTGDVNNDVFIVQNNLFIWGFLDAEPDGIFGPGTKQALSDFQNYSFEDMVAYTNAQNTAEATPEPTAEPTAPADGAYQMAMVEDMAISEIPTDGTLTADWMDFLLNGFETDVVEIRENDKGIRSRCRPSSRTIGWEKGSISSNSGIEPFTFSHSQSICRSSSAVNPRLPSFLTVPSCATIFRQKGSSVPSCS